VKRSSVQSLYHHYEQYHHYVAEASNCTVKYFNEASVLYIFLTLDARGINVIRSISRPIHAPSHELEDTDTNTPPTEVISKMILVELLGTTEDSVILYLWGLSPLAYFVCFSMLKLDEAQWLLMLDGASLILLLNLAVFNCICTHFL
jgi:hypothetical protein